MHRASRLLHAVRHVFRDLMGAMKPKRRHSESLFGGRRGLVVLPLRERFTDFLQRQQMVTHVGRGCDPQAVAACSPERACRPPRHRGPCGHDDPDAGQQPCRRPKGWLRRWQRGSSEWRMPCPSGCSGRRQPRRNASQPHMILIICVTAPADDRIRCLNPQIGPLWKGHRPCSRPCRSGFVDRPTHKPFRRPLSCSRAATGRKPCISSSRARFIWSAHR